MFKILSALLLMVTVCSRAWAAQPIPTIQLATNIDFPATPWKGIVGVKGGIPNRTTINATLTASATAAQINTAIDNCTSNEVVLLQAGSYTLTGGIDLDKSGVTLRGETNAFGVPTTFITFNTTADPLIDLSLGGGIAGDWNAQGFVGTTRTVSSGLSRGSTSCVLDSTSGLAAGMMVIFSAPRQGDHSGSGFTNFKGSPGRAATFFHWVTNVSGTTIEFEPPFQPDHWTGTLECSYRTVADTVMYSGLENLMLTRSSAQGGSFIEIAGTANCWAYNIWSSNTVASREHIDTYMSYRTEVRHCWFRGHYDLASETYPWRAVQSSFLLFIDNIVTDAPAFAALYGLNGSAIIDNYRTNSPYFSTNFLGQGLFYHGSHSSFNLIEGSIFERSYNDTDNPSSWCTTYHRNYNPGWDGNSTGAGKWNDCFVSAWGTSVTTNYNNAKLSFVGNVLGKNNKQTVYDDTNPGVNAVAGIYRIGATAAPTMLRKQNYNWVDGAIPAGEALGGGEALVNSYYWEANDLGHPIFPPYDPTTPLDSYHTNTQAGHRYHFTTNYEVGGGRILKVRALKLPITR